jgi:hypothetical protein
MMSGIGFSYVAFIMLRYVSSILSFIRDLSWKDVEFYWRFLCTYWDDIVAFVLDSIYVALYLLICVCWKHPCVPGNKPIWSWCMIFLMCCWIWFRSILRIFCINVHQEKIVCNVLFVLHPYPVWALGKY